MWGDLTAPFGIIIMIVGLAILILPCLSSENKYARRIGSGLVVLLMLRYLAWRALDSLPPLSFSVETLIAYGFFAVEVVSSFAGLLMLHVLSKTVDRSAEADAHPPESFDPIPLIDVFIPTYNEKREILERTVVGALAMDYPRFRVWVLDDSRRPWLKDMTEELGAHYLTRYENSHGKAGNMNNGLKHVFALPEPPNIIAVLDADFVPTPLFLRRAMALFHDPTVGVVQTPQHFFNKDPIQLNLGGARVVPDEQRFFFDVILASKDAHGTAFSCGTSALVRAEALKAIGLFPTESVTEDLLLSIKMTTIGCKTVYLNESLSVGLAPEGMHEYLTQRGRWCLGTMQVARTPWSPFTSQGGVPLLMRLHTLDTFLFWTAGSLVRVLGVLIPICYWWFGLVVMVTDLPTIISYLGPYWVTAMIYMGWVSRGTNLPVLAEAMGMVIASEALKASFIGLFGSKNQKFKVTAKGTSRDRAVVQWGVIKWLALLAGLTIGGIAWRVWQGPLPGTPAAIETMNLFWSIFNISALFLACLMCVDQPRSGEESFDADEPVTVHGARTLTARLRSLSMAGCEIEAVDGIGLTAGAEVAVEMAAVTLLNARIIRIAGSVCQMSFEATQAQRLQLIRKIFSGGYVRSVSRMGALKFASIVARRAFGSAV
jgi:cellulose synthase (UDP-forming)